MVQESVRSKSSVPRAGFGGFLSENYFSSFHFHFSTLCLNRVCFTSVSRSDSLLYMNINTINVK